MMTTIAAGDGSRILEPRRTVVRDATDWRVLWAAHAGPETAPPPVDFATHFVAAAFSGEQPSAGCGIAITGSRQRNGSLEVLVDEHGPTSGMVAAQVVVTPFHIVSLPRHDGAVGFAPAGGVPAPARSGSGAGAQPLVSSTGLEPNVAASLAYLAGPFSGVLLLLAERTHPSVRFHAWQSILALGGLGVLSVLFLLGAFAALLVSPTGFTVMYWTAFLTAVAWVLLWAACLVHAFTGRAWHLPVVGDIAERRARAVGA